MLKTTLKAASAAILLSSMTTPMLVQAETMPEVETAEASAVGLNINTATAAELAQGMTGVGVKRAEMIIKLREQLGGFTELQQLLDVKGIGIKTLDKNKASIRIE